ncbi:DNA translocase FtsK, partial [Methylopila musalis]
MTFSGRPPASDSDATGRRTADPRRQAAPSEVRSVRTPDHVLRERRARDLDDALDASVAVTPHPSGPLIGLDALYDAHIVPSWLQPFAIGPNARFTRTPDSILRGHAGLPEDEALEPIAPETAADAIAAMTFDEAEAAAEAARAA